MVSDYVWNEALGFKAGKSGAHSARSLMIEELSNVMDNFPQSTSANELKEEIVTNNLLRKSTANSRRLTLRHMVDLYGLNDNACLFRTFRKLWHQAPDSRSVLALQLALCRDPILRISMPAILKLEPGEAIARQDIEALLEEHNPGGYSTASLKSFAQNINGSWTQAGILQGRTRKTRTAVSLHAANVAYALFIGYLQKLQGQRAFDSDWCKLLSRDKDQLNKFAHVASLHGYLNFKHIGDVIEVSFPGWLNDKDMEALNG